MKIPKARKLPSGSWNIYMMVAGERISITAPTKKEAEQQASIVYQSAEKVQEKISGVAVLLKGDYSMEKKHDAIAEIVENITFSVKYVVKVYY